MLYEILVYVSSAHSWALRSAHTTRCFYKVCGKVFHIFPILRNVRKETTMESEFEDLAGVIVDEEKAAFANSLVAWISEVKRGHCRC